jgi:hypothetical protein
MAPLISISDPRLLHDLIDSFLKNDCVAHAVGMRLCQVIHVHADDPEQARVEVTFFLRSWQLRHPGVTAELHA